MYEGTTESRRLRLPGFGAGWRAAFTPPLPRYLIAVALVRPAVLRGYAAGCAMAADQARLNAAEHHVGAVLRPSVGRPDDREARTGRPRGRHLRSVH